MPERHKWPVNTDCFENPAGSRFVARVNVQTNKDWIPRFGTLQTRRMLKDDVLDLGLNHYRPVCGKRRGVDDLGRRMHKLLTQQRGEVYELTTKCCTSGPIGDASGSKLMANVVKG
jgi:hypothetical protein